MAWGHALTLIFSGTLEADARSGVSHETMVACGPPPAQGTVGSRSSRSEPFGDNGAGLFLLRFPPRVWESLISEPEGEEAL